MNDTVNWLKDSVSFGHDSVRTTKSLPENKKPSLPQQRSLDTDTSPTSEQQGDQRKTRSASLASPPPLVSPVTMDFEDSGLNTEDESDLLKEHEMMQLSEHFPGRLMGNLWRRRFSSETDGFSLKRLYKKLEGYSGCCLLAVKDHDQYVFGAFTSDPFRISENFYGTGETFLYRVTSDGVQV